MVQLQLQLRHFFFVPRSRACLSKKKSSSMLYLTSVACVVTARDDQSSPPGPGLGMDCLALETSLKTCNSHMEIRSTNFLLN